MKTVGPSVRDRQIFGRTAKFFNLSVRLTDKKMPIILQWFYAGPIKNRPDRQNIGLVGPADRQKFDGFHILCINIILLRISCKRTSYKHKTNTLHRINMPILSSTIHIKCILFFFFNAKHGLKPADLDVQHRTYTRKCTWMGYNLNRKIHFI